MIQLWQGPTVALLACVATLTGCSAADNPGPATTSTTISSQLEAISAREAMASFGLTMPDVESALLAQPPDENLRFQGVVTFVAPREQVIDQTCRNVQHKSFDEPPILQGIDYTLYQSFAFPRIDPNTYGSCYQFASGRKINVLVPRINGHATFVILYDMRFR